MTQSPMIAAAALLMLAAACSPEPEPEAPADRADSAIDPAAPGEIAPPVPATARESVPPLTESGYADFIVGRPIAVANPANLSEQPAVSEDCRMFRDRRFPDLWIMTNGKRVIQRVSAIGKSPLKTSAGIGLGASEAAVRAAYPGIRKERSDYVMPPGGILFTAADDRPGLRFDLDEQAKVVEISGGAPPFLGYSEGCA